MSCSTQKEPKLSEPHLHGYYTCPKIKPSFEPSFFIPIKNICGFGSSVTQHFRVRSESKKITSPSYCPILELNHVKRVHQDTQN